MSDPQLASDLSLMESLSKFFAVLLGILYLLGFLIVAIHLSKYGVSSFSVLQLQYLIAGLWLLGLPVLFGCAVVASRVFEERLTPDVEGQFNWRRFLINGSFGGAITVLFIILLLSIPNLADDLTRGIILGLLLFEVVIMNLAQMFWISWRQTTSSKNTWLLNCSAAAPFYLVVLAIVVLLYATWFSKHLYPLIPFSLGGWKAADHCFHRGRKKNAG
jgi:hypothetical protein